MTDRIDTKGIHVTTKQYTAEDFANAEAARHPDGRIAARLEDGHARPWGIEEGDWLSDRDLAEQGWEPAHIWHNPQKMRRHISDLEAIIKRRGEDIERLEEQRARLARELAVERERTITLDALQAAWEGAEQEGHANKGDVIIRRACDGEDFAVGVSVWSGWTDEGVRILHRAPKREPWQDLADVLGTDNGELIGEHHTITEVAKALHERGVRVTEEGEKK